MSENRYTIGLDFGSDSVRGLIVQVDNGCEIASAVVYYPRWKEGLYSDASLSKFRHHPLDYIESMTKVIQEVLKNAPIELAKQIIGIGVDTTGSTPAPVNQKGEILALLPEFKENPNAMFVLWKDHTSVAKAELINELAHSGNYIDYTQYVGGLYSSEWFWAKAAWVQEQDASVAQAAYSWVELADWIPALLSGNEAPGHLRRGVCAAGHKSLWHESWNGLPSQEFLTAISPTFAGIRERMGDFKTVYTSDQCAGYLSDQWAKKLGLPSGIAVAIGEFDCHMGAVGAGASVNDLVKVIGTSTCDILMASPESVADQCIQGICGQVHGSAVPELIALEAGQSAFGDLYAWYRRLLMWPLQQWAKDHPEAESLYHSLDDALIPMLADVAQTQLQTLQSPLAVDWHNGRRTPYANQRLTGELSGLNLGSDAVMLFHSLVESTAHGAKAIMDCMIDQGMQVDRVLAIGGIANKSAFVMQTCADVMGRPIEVAKSEQCCALGAAIFAAVAAGAYPNTSDAQKKMASPIESSYQPNAERHKFYQQRFLAYQELGKHVDALTHYRMAESSK